MVDSNNQPVTQLFGSAGNPFGGPVPVTQSLILGPAVSNEWVSFTLGQEAIFGFGNAVATDNVFVAVLANGAGETGTLFGRDQATNPWVSLGTIFEPLVGGITDPPNVQMFSLVNVGLSQVNQLKIVSNSSGGSFQGLDVAGLGAISPVPIPAAFLLFGSGLAGIAILRRAKK